MGKGLKEQIEKLERRMILDALHRSDGVRVQAARELGISERVLRYKLKKYGIRIETKMSNIYKTVEPSTSYKNDEIQ